MDIFCEYIVKKKKTTADFIFGIGMVLIGLILTYFIMIFQILFFGFAFFAMCMMWFGVYILIRMRSVEFEYIFTDHYLDIDKIMAKRKRKRLISLDYKDALIAACVTDKKYQSEYDNKNSIKKTHNFVGKEEKDIYFIDFPSDQGNIRILIQPSDKMKESMKAANPRITHIL